MNDTINQNGFSSSQLSGHMHHGSMPSTTGRRADSREFNSTGLPDSCYQSVCANDEKESERVYQSREVLLNLLQPPGNSRLRAQRSTCTLPCPQAEKTSSDLCGSRCLRRTEFQHVALSPGDMERGVNDGWSQQTWHGNCINPENIRQKQNIFTHREAIKSHFQDRQAVPNPPCADENLSRMDTNRANVPSIAVRCQNCEARTRPIHSGEPQSRCQNFPTDHQQCSKEHACCQKDISTQDSKSTVQYIAVQMDTGRQRKDEGRLKEMYPPTPCYKGCDSWMCPSNQTVQRDRAEMGVEGNGKLPILHSTERLPECSVESGKDPTHQVEKTAHKDPSFTTQEGPDDHERNSLPSYSMCSSASYGCKPFCPSGEMVSPAVRIVNGDERLREERKLRLEEPPERDHQTVLNSPNKHPPPVKEPQSDECTPVIVHCYSLSTASSSLEPPSMDDLHFVNRRVTNANLHGISGDPTFLASHPRYLYQQHSPRSLKSASCLQSDEDFMYHSTVPGPRGIPRLHSHNFMPQPKHTLDESSTSELVVDDEEKQTRTATLPEQFHKRRSIPPSCPCQNCQHPFKNGYDRTYIQTPRRDHHPFNDHWAETHRNNSGNDSQTRIVHVPSDFQMRRSSVDLRNGHDSGDKFPNWQTRKVPSLNRPALKIHDYYEERRILVGKVYQNVPGSLESSQFNPRSTIPFGHTEQFYRKEPYQNSVASAQVFQAHADEQNAIEMCSREQEIAVGSKKRKSRQPRPQRGKTSDPALAREEQQHQSQQEEEGHEDLSHSNYHPPATSPFQHRASISEETSSKGREGVGESEMRTCEPVHESANPIQHKSVPRREDHVFDSNPSGPEVCRREFPPEGRSPRRPFVHVKRTNGVSSERSGRFSEFSRGPPDVPPYEPVGNDDYANPISREYPMNSYYQTETPNKYFAHSNDDAVPKGNATQPHRLGPTRIMRGPENHFESPEKIRSSYDSDDVSFSPRKLGSYFGPSQRSMPTHESVTESAWSVPATPIHAGPRGDGFYHHTVSASAKDKSPQSESEMQAPSDNGYVSSTTADDGVEIQSKHDDDDDDDDQPFQSSKSTSTTNRGERSLKEQGNRGYFLHTREVWANYVAPAIKERKFVCRYCSKKFAHFSTLQNHIRTHTGDKPFQCKFCSRRFAQSGVLKAHLRTHTGDKPFACMYCGKMFAQSTTLTNHLRTHTGHKPYICQFCSKSFSQPSTLRKHELSHTKERPYPCKFCGKAFAQQSTLTNHLRSHTGQRPYKCHFCEKGFAQLSTLDRHLRLHSSASVKPYQCRHCSKSFSYFSNLSSHMQHHQQEQK